MKFKRNRPAIAMIELIFSIVIMGIVMMSAPMLISTAASSVSVALQQEGINEGVSRASMILTYEWDENDINNTCIPPVLGVSGSGDSELNKVIGTGRRIGVPITTDSHTFKCGTAEFNASSSLGSESGDKDDIDDFLNDPSLIEDFSGSGGKDYLEKLTVSIASNIYYTSDAANYNSTSFAYDFTPNNVEVNSTNIKAIQITVTSSSGISELAKEIVLNAFSCNIGGYNFEPKVLP